MARKKAEHLTVDQVKFIRMEANGYTTADIIKALYGVTKESDPKTFHNWEAKMSRWRDHPKYEQTWKEEVKKQDYGDYTAARRVLRKKMMQEKDGWLAMQSAVNVLNNSGKRIYASEDSAITVKVEGMPDIGSPDDE